MTDSYKIVLTGGNEAGVFGGTSRAFGDWSGRMEGHYVFKNEKH